MKGSCTLVASMLAASTVALSSSPSSAAEGRHVSPHPNEKEQKGGAGAYTASSGEEKFAPRFDGLRFIETLVTAHR